MSNRVRSQSVQRAALRAVLAALAAIHLAGCATEITRSPRALPLLLSDYQAVAVPRGEIARYRCASGAMLQCGGPSDQTAQCVCSPLIGLWPAP